jgi:alkanesulfonate monooxygenase SsuD/methylene tetrahydromethanopterin reductase-like flavin-dependent oxidoreductase (luciferase family)
VKVGLVIVDEHPRTALEVAKAAEVAGVHSIWTIDYYNRSSLARASAFVAATESIVVGTSVTPLFARSPLALAAAAHDIQLMSGGRFVLGVGSSTRRMNKDWYGVELEHPAPRVEDRIRLLRKLLQHRGGSLCHDGRFDSVALAHFDREVVSDVPTPIHAAGVGARMITAAGREADGFVGHTVASIENLSTQARPTLAAALSERGRPSTSFAMTSQIVASADERIDVARDRAARQVGFYSTPKGYDVLFTGEQQARARGRAREALVAGDADGVGRAGLGLVEERAVFGTTDQVMGQLAGYAEVLDVALLYPPNFGVELSEVTKNEYALIEVAAEWNGRVG